MQRNALYVVLLLKIEIIETSQEVFILSGWLDGDNTKSLFGNSVYKQMDLLQYLLWKLSKF